MWSGGIAYPTDDNPWQSMTMNNTLLEKKNVQRSRSPSPGSGRRLSLNKLNNTYIDDDAARGDGANTISDRLNFGGPQRVIQADPIIEYVPVFVEKEEVKYIKEEVSAVPEIIYDDSINQNAINIVAEGMSKIALLIMENNRLRLQESNADNELAQLRRNHIVMPPPQEHVIVSRPTEIQTPIPPPQTMVIECCPTCKRPFPPGFAGPRSIMTQLADNFNSIQFMNGYNSDGRATPSVRTSGRPSRVSTKSYVGNKIVNTMIGDTKTIGKQHFLIDKPVISTLVTPAYVNQTRRLSHQIVNEQVRSIPSPRIQTTAIQDYKMQTVQPTLESSGIYRRTTSQTSLVRSSHNEPRPQYCIPTIAPTQSPFKPSYPTPRRSFDLDAISPAATFYSIDDSPYINQTLPPGGFSQAIQRHEISPRPKQVQFNTFGDPGFNIWS